MPLDSNPPLDSVNDPRRQEAARYAVMRRLAPTLRHHMAGEFQPLTILAALVERSLKTGDLDKAIEHSHSLSQQSRLASQRCAGLLDWTLPPGSAPSPARQALQDCARLVGAVLRLRGFDLTLHPHELSRAFNPGVWRSLLPAALLYLSDQAQAPGHLYLRAQQADGQTVIDIRIELQPATELKTPERPIRWDDVCALAQAEGCDLELMPDGLRLILVRKN